jgi:uncharacterized membrane protein HdeD (DUF308 family)
MSGTRPSHSTHQTRLSPLTASPKGGCKIVAALARRRSEDLMKDWGQVAFVVGICGLLVGTLSLTEFFSSAKSLSDRVTRLAYSGGPAVVMIAPGAWFAHRLYVLDKLYKPGTDLLKEEALRNRIKNSPPEPGEVNFTPAMHENLLTYQGRHGGQTNEDMADVKSAIMKSSFGYVKLETDLLNRLRKNGGPSHTFELTKIDGQADTVEAHKKIYAYHKALSERNGLLLYTLGAAVTTIGIVSILTTLPVPNDASLYSWLGGGLGGVVTIGCTVLAIGAADEALKIGRKHAWVKDQYPDWLCTIPIAEGEGYLFEQSIREKAQ